MEKEKKIPKVFFEDEELKIIKQDHTNEGLVKLELKGELGHTATVLIRDNGTYDEFIKNPEGGLISYNNKELEDV